MRGAQGCGLRRCGRGAQFRRPSSVGPGCSLLWLRVPSQVASGSRKDELVSKKLGVSRGEGRVV